MNVSLGYTVGTQHPSVTSLSDDLVERVQRELATAADLEEKAREHRRQAGRLLAAARAQHPDAVGWEEWIRSAGLDRRSVDLLMQLHAGGLPR